MLNQFSMDEYEGYFRIATTTGARASYKKIKINSLENLDEINEVELP